MKEPVLSHPNSTISEIIGLLRARNSYEVFIEERKRVGVITTRDLLSVRNINTRKSSSIIKHLPRITPVTTLGTAVKLMAEYRLRSFPIVQDDKVIGQVNAASVMERVAKSIQASKLKAQSLMTKDPVTISRDTLATTARRLMQRRRIDHLPVLEDRKVYGILTSSHLVNALLPSSSVKAGGRWGSRRGGALGAESVRRFDYPSDRLLNRHTVKSAIDHPLSRIVNDIINSDSTYSLVIVAGELRGIIAFRDIIKLVADAEEIEDIRVNIIGLPDDPLEAELSKRKFQEVVRKVNRVFPNLQEAVAIIKTKDTGGRRRYEVKIKLVTPRRIRSYTGSGWDLPSVYDRLSDRLKRLVSSKPSRKRESIRRRRV